MKFREDRRKIWTTWEERVSEDTCLERAIETKKAASSEHRLHEVTTIYACGDTSHGHDALHIMPPVRVRQILGTLCPSFKA